MAKKNKLTDEEILSLIEREEGVSYGINDSQLSGDREKALKYYNGDPLGNEVEGRSQVVSRDVLDTVEAALPQILKVFVAGDEVVKFNPRGLEDEEAAQQETDYINYVVMEKNPGFMVFATWFKDALISKNGYVKVWYEQEKSTEHESYQGLTDIQITLLLQDASIEVLEHTAYPDPAIPPQVAMQFEAAGQALPMLHDIRIALQSTKDCIKMANVAPEDIMVSQDCREISVQAARFVQHRVMMTREDMEAQDWDVPDDLGGTENDDSPESLARDQYGETREYGEDDLIQVRDTYLMIDGQRERFVVAGNHIVWRESAEIVPIATLTPHVSPHRHIGMSYADLTTDLQEIKTALIRGQLDNMYLSNNGRYAISDRVNLQDMLTSRPGGVVRVSGEPASAIMPLAHTPFPPTSFTMVEYFDSVKEKRTGITAYNQGLNADSLNKTATGISQIMSASQQRIELVARTFAETGVKELFMLVHRLVRKYYTRPDIMRLRKKWVDVDPRQWKTRSDMSVAVGIGTGNKDQMLGHLMTILQAQKEAIVLGIATPKNIYNALVKLTQNAGFKNTEEFWTDPSTNPQQQKPPQPSPDTLVMAKTEIDKAHIKAQSDEQKVAMQAQLDRQNAAHNMQQEQMRSQNDLVIEREKIAMQADLEKFKAELKAETDLAIAQMRLERQAMQQPSAPQPGVSQ